VNEPVASSIAKTCQSKQTGTQAEAVTPRAGVCPCSADTAIGKPFKRVVRYNSNTTDDQVEKRATPTRQIFFAHARSTWCRSCHEADAQASLRLSVGVPGWVVLGSGVLDFGTGFVPSLGRKVR
jgi:hypothetical protein